MHIGFLSPEYPHPLAVPSAGLGTSIKNLAESLVERDVSVSVFLYGQKEELQFEEGGIQFYFIRQKKYKVGGWFLYRKHLQKFLNRVVLKEKIDIIEAPDWTGITAFMNLHCSLVIRLHGSDAYFCKLEKRPQKKKNYWFEKLAIKTAERIVSVSKFTAGETAGIFHISKEITIIPNMVDIKKFVPYEGQVKPNTLLYFGSLIRKKGVLELASIFNKVVEIRPEANLYLVGKDVIDVFENFSTFELFKLKLSPEAVDRVKYIPEVKYKEIRDYIASAAVIVLPSFAEALPMTWLEAMAMEKAMVTSNIGWAGEIMIPGKTGFIEDPNDHKAYAEKILYLMDNPEEADRMGKAARQQVLKKFSTGVVVEENLRFYGEVVGNGRREDSGC